MRDWGFQLWESLFLGGVVPCLGILSEGLVGDIQSVPFLWELWVTVTLLNQ